MEERLKIIYESFDELAHDMNAAFTTRDKELLKNQFFRSHRLVSKLLYNIHKKIQEREYYPSRIILIV